jgi:type I restriction enzyme S subunit
MRGKFWANNHIHVLKAIEGILINEFLMYCLNFIDLTPFLTGSTRPKLTQEDMRKIPLPLPPIQEQQKIAEILSAVDSKIKLENMKKAKLERIKQGLMDLLLTGKIRVKVS